MIFMKQSIFTVLSNEKIAVNTFKTVLEGDTSAITASGQFVNIKLDGFYLRRPISVCDYDGESLTIIYKAVGKGQNIWQGFPRVINWTYLQVSETDMI